MYLPEPVGLFGLIALSPLVRPAACHARKLDLPESRSRTDRAQLPPQTELREMADRNLRVLDSLSPVGNALLLHSSRLTVIDAAPAAAVGSKAAEKLGEAKERHPQATSPIASPSPSPSPSP